MKVWNLHLSMNWNWNRKLKWKRKEKYKKYRNLSWVGFPPFGPRRNFPAAQLTPRPSTARALGHCRLWSTRRSSSSQLRVEASHLRPTGSAETNATPNLLCTGWFSLSPSFSATDSINRLYNPSWLAPWTEELSTCAERGREMPRRRRSQFRMLIAVHGNWYKKNPLKTS